MAESITIPNQMLAALMPQAKMTFPVFSTINALGIKGLGSRRGEFGPAIEMHTGLKYVYMVYFIEKNRNFICLVLKL